MGCKMNNEKSEKTNQINRRDFLIKGSAIGLGAIAAGHLITSCDKKERSVLTKAGLPKVAPIETVRIGFVGVGNQGSSHVRNFLNIEGVEIRAICDIIPEKV